MDILKNNRRNTDFSHLGIQSINTSGYGDVSRTTERAALENEVAKLVSKQLDEIDYDQLAAETGAKRKANYLETENTAAGTVADVWRQTNVQGHSVNLSKKQDELLNTEGSWVPQIDSATQYLQNKKRIQELISTDAASAEHKVQIEQEIDSLLQQNSQLEPVLRDVARTNPYLQDVFYETTPGKLLSTDTFGSVSDVLKYYTYDYANSDYAADLDPSNNFKHMLSTNGVKTGLFGTTHKLSDEQLNTMWNMKNNTGSKYTLDEQINKLQKLQESANLQYQSKTEDILDKINTVKKGNALFDPTKIDPNFIKNFENNEISAKDPKSWVYALPHLGSSYSEIGAMVGQIGASALLHGAAKGALAVSTGGTLPLLYAMTEGAANLAIAQYMRESETKSEAFDAYNARVTKETGEGNIDLNAIQAQVLPTLGKLGYDVENMKDHEIFSAMVAQNLRTDNTEFNTILDNSKKGLDVVRQTNEALSLGDYAQSMMFSYGGAYLSKAYGAKQLAKTSAGMADKRMLAANFEKSIDMNPNIMGNLPLFKQAGQVIDRTTTRVASKVLGNKISGIAVKNATSTIANLGKSMGINYFTERTEEGQQYIVSKKYKEGDYDNSNNYTFLDGVANALTLGVEANEAYYGVHKNSSLNTDQDLINSMKIGGFTGLFMSGIYASSDILNTAKQVKSDIKLRGLVADNYAEAERDFKIDQFLNVGKKYGNFSYVHNTLQELKKNKPDGVTDEMIDEDIELAKKVYAYSGSKQTKDNLKAAGIKENSEDYNKFIQNAVHLEDRYQSQSTSAEESNKKREQLISQIQRDFTVGSDNKIVQDWLEEQYKSYVAGKGKKEEDKEEEIVSKEVYFGYVFGKVIASIENRAIEKLSAELQERENDLTKLAEEQKLDVNVKGISSIRKYVDNLRKVSSQKVEKLVETARGVGMKGTDIEVLEKIAASTPAIELEEQLTGSTVESVVNNGALLDLMEHRKAYLTGKYTGEIDAYTPTWNNLTESQRKDIVSTKTEDATKSGIPIPTLKEIQKQYDAVVKQAVSEQDEQADVNALQKSRAVAVFMQDLKHRIKFEKIAKQEKAEQFGLTQDEPTQQEVNKVIEETEKQAVSVDELAEVPATPEQETEVPTTLIEQKPESVDGIAEDKPLVEQDNVKEDTGLQSALNQLDKQLAPEVDTTTDVLESDEVAEFEDDMDVTEIQLTEEAANQNIDLNANTVLEAELNRAEEVFSKQTEDAVEEINKQIEAGNKIEEEVAEKEESADEIKKKDEAELGEAKKEEKTPEETTTVPEVPTPDPIQIPTVEGEQQSETPFNMLEPDAIDIFINPETQMLMWDPSGNQNLSNAITIDEQALEAQQQFEDVYDSNPFASPMSSQNSSKAIDETPGLTDNHKQKKNGTRNTFFFQPDAEDIMPITVAGKPLTVITKDGKPANRRPGKELAENLAIPGWVQSADDIYYVVTSSTHKSNNPIDDLAIHMLIEKDGKVYNASLRAISTKLFDDLKFLGLTKEEIDSEIEQLRKLRAKIIDAYSQEYKQTGHLPTEAQRHVKATGIRISNGTLNNQKRAVTIDQTVPVYRSLTEVADFGIPSDPNELSEQLRTGEVEIGYGTGPFAMITEPFAIMRVMEREPTEVQGKGYAGKLYYIPQPSKTPSQRVTLPIMLAEELHTISALNADEVMLTYDENGKPLYKEDGSIAPLQTAELIFEMLRNPAFFGEATQDLLDILCHSGKRTLTAGLDEAEQKNYHFLVKKQLYVFENSKGERILITAGRKLENDPSKGYRTRYTNLSKLTASQKRQIVLDISRNIHWNTDKDVMASSIPNSIVNLILASAKTHPEFDEKYRYRFGTLDLSFSLEDIGYTKKDGQIVKSKPEAEVPLTLSWMINQKKIKTDLGEHAFRAPFVYADDVAVSDVEKPAAKTVQKVVTTSNKVIAEKEVKPTTEKGPKMAEPATAENLAKYGLTIPTDQQLLKGRVWGIAEIRGQHKVVQAPKQYVTGVFSIVQGTGKVDFSKAKHWLTETLGIDPDNVIAVNAAMRMHSDMQVFGVMNVAVDTIHNMFNPRITLSTTAGKGIEFHEGFHYVSLLLLDPQMRQALYQDYVDRNKKAKGYTKEQVEEALAEEFRSWMLKETNPTLGYKATKFFRQALQFIQRLRGKGLNYTVFKAIRDGKFKEATVDQETLKEFKNAYDKGVFYYIPGLTADDQTKIPHITDSSTFYRIIDSLTSTALAVYGIRSYEDVKKLNVNSIFDQIQDNLDMGWIEEANGPIAEDVITNVDIFRNKILARLGELSIKEIELLETEESNKLASETGTSTDNAWNKNQGEISKKANVSFGAKLFFYSIPKTEYRFVEDVDGNITKVLEEIKDPIFGLPITESFDIVWNKIMENLWDSETYEDIIKRSKKLGDTDPFFKVLYDQLVSVENPISVNTQTQLINTIKSSKNSMTTVDIRPDNPSLVFGMSDEHIADEIQQALKRSVWSIQDSDNLRKIARYPKQWSNAFFTSNNVEILEDGSRKVSELGFKFMASKRNAINTLVKQIQKNNKKTTDNLASTEQILKDRFIELCNGLKIPFDHLALDYMLSQFKDSGKVPGYPQINQFISMWEAYGKSFRSVLADITKIYSSKQASAQTRGGVSFRSLDRIFTSSDKNAQINLMAVAYGKTHPSPEEFSVTGADNSLVYPISENNYMSDQVRWLNQDLNQKRTNILKTPYSKRSILANNKGKIKLHTLLAVNDKVSGTSRDYFGISPLEDYITKLVLTFNDHLTLPTMSDKKTWYSISGITLPKNILGSYVSVTDLTESGLPLTTVAPMQQRFSGKTLEIMSNYFLDELDAIIDYYQHKDYVAAHPEEFVTNYHGKIVNGKMSAGGNGGRFRYFGTLKVNGETVNLNQDLSKRERNGSTQDVLDYLNDAKKLFTDKNNTVLKEAVNDLLLDKTLQEMSKLETLGILQRKDGLTSNKLIPHNVMKFYEEQFKQIPYEDKEEQKHDIIMSIIGTHVANTIVSIQELEKCFVGDPAYYKWQSSKQVEVTKDLDGNEINLEYEVITGRDVDKIKRLSSVLSTGTNLRTYWGPGQDEKNNTKFTVMNLEDNMVTSTYYPLLLQAFRNSLIRDMVSSNNPQLVDSQLIEMTNTEEKQEEQYKKLSSEQRKFVDEQSLNSAKPYGKEEINQADAAVYIRPAMYRRIIEALGEWSPEVEAAFDMMESPDTDWLSDSTKFALAMNTLIKPLKMMYFGDHRSDKLNLNIPVFDKMAIFPMFRVLAQADNKVLYDRMNNSDLGEIDMVAFESAIKVGGRQKIKVYKDGFNEQFDTEVLNRPSYTKYGKVGNLPTYEQDLSQLRLQLNTEPHEHMERSFGTQAVKICLGNAIDDRVYGENKGRAITGETIKKGVMDSIKSLSSKGQTSVLRRFFKDGKIDNEKLSEFLISQAKSSGLSDEFIYGLSLNEKGEFRMPLAAMSSRNWVESRIISLVNKECIDVNTPGGSAVQMSSFGFKATGARKQEAIGKAFNNGEKLKFVNADGSMDVMLSTNFFRHVVPQEHQVSYAAMREWLLKENIIGENSKPFGIGYRIPTQGLSSTFAFKVMDVMPAVVGDTIIVPDEFTGQTGSDFDVDKVFLATYAYEDGKYVDWAIDEDGTELPPNKQSKKALVNRMLDYYTLIVSDHKNMAETRASIDTLTKLLQNEILPLVSIKSKVEAPAMYELMPSFQLSRKEEYTGGKAGIAPFALNSTNHCLTQLVHLNMDYSHSNVYGLGQFDEIKGQDGFRILDWLSAMINAHVDVAKDPYIMALNVNQITYNITNLLLRGGKGKTTFYFLAQPILKAYTSKKIASAGVYGVDEKKFDNQLIGEITRGYETKLRDLILTLDPSSTQYAETVSLFNGWIAYKDSNDTNAVKPIVTTVKSTLPYKAEALDEKLLMRSLKEAKEETPMHLYQQLLVMKAYAELDNDAKIMSELVHRSQIDTKKFGNNIADQMNFKNSYNTFIEDNANRFTIKGIPYDKTDPKFALQKYFGDTFLSKKLYLGTSLPRKILKSQTFPATKLYESIFTSVMSTFGSEAEITTNTGNVLPAYKHVGDKKLVKILNQSIESIVRARITRQVSRFQVSDSKLSGMFYGKNTICKKLSGVKQYIIENKDEFPYLVGQDGVIKNDLLNYLQEYSGNGVSQKADRILLFNSSMDNSVSTENKLISAFSDLLESHNDLIKEFANDLALYAYFTSYDNRGVNSFYHLVPLWWKDLNGYISSIKDSLDAFSYNPDSGISTISESNDTFGYYPSINIVMARNLWRNDQIVKPHVFNADRGDKNIYATKLKIGNSITMTPTVFATRRDDNFIKMQTGKDSENTQLYKKIAEVYYEHVESGKQVAKKSIYQVVPKLGFNDNGYQIYEFQKDSLEPSAFDINSFSEDMSIDTDHIGDDVISKALPKIKKNAEEYKAVFNAYTDEAIKSRIKKEDSLINTNDSETIIEDTSVSNVESFGNTEAEAGTDTFGADQVDAETISTEEMSAFEQELATEMFTLGNTAQEIIDFGEEFSMMPESTPEITESGLQTFEDTESLALLGKKRIKECE